MTSQLEKDLHKRTEERLLLLCKDTFDLFDMAGLDDTKAAQTLAIVLMHETAHIVASSEADARAIGHAFAGLVTRARQENGQARKAKAGGTAEA